MTGRGRWAGGQTCERILDVGGPHRGSVGGSDEPHPGEEHGFANHQSFEGDGYLGTNGLPPPRVHDSVALCWYERLKSRLGPAPGRQISSCDDMDMLAELLLHVASYDVPRQRYRMYRGPSVYGEVDMEVGTYRGRFGGA